ncbi:MAG: hypothetical protein JSW65_04775 [Candidatus Bipolaricaulota bacterium]|nr:MAG: hypothetical protein JSW65_04775 [Candidatus Bipolaricaulota bacterium]
MGEPDVTTKWVEPRRAATRRLYVDGIGELALSLDRAQGELKLAVEGAPFALLLERDEKKGIHVELAFPVSADATASGFEVKEIAGDHVLSTVHTGPYRGGDEGENLIDTVRGLWGFISERRLLAGDNPSRYIFLEGEATHGDDSARYRTEVQISYHTPVWFDALDRGLRRHAGTKHAQAIMKDAALLLGSFDSDAIRRFVLEAVRRTGDVVSDEGERARILQDCAHRYPHAQLDRLRAAYDEIGDLRAFIARLAEDDALFPAKIWLDEKGQTPLVYIERSVPPWNREAYEATDDPVEKRYHACFCVMVRDAIRTGEAVPPEFCDCSAGWYVQMWSAILDRRLRIDVVESVLRGDDRCLFAVHVPQELL